MPVRYKALHYSGPVLKRDRIVATGVLAFFPRSDQSTLRWIFLLRLIRIICYMTIKAYIGGITVVSNFPLILRSVGLCVAARVPKRSAYRSRTCRSITKRFDLGRS